MYPEPTIQPAIKLFFASLCLVLLSACMTKQQVGSVVGSVAGGVLGSKVGAGTGRVAATIAGSALGGILGGNIGRSMDQADQQRTQAALESTPTGNSTEWQNPDTGNRYSVTPTKTYYQGNSESTSPPCREFTSEAWIEGERQTLTGVACRQPDGTWKSSQ